MRATPPTRSPRARRSPILAPALAFVAACEGAPTATSSRPHGRIALQLANAPAHARGAEGGALAQQPQQPLRPVASIVAEARLSAGAQAQAQPISVRRPSASFAVTVPEGEVRFAAQVVSNTGVTLFTGDTTVTVDRDDFLVAVSLRAVTAVLGVASDTVRMTFSAGSALVVLNRGNVPLTWAVDAASPALRDCGGPCVSFGTADGPRPTVAPGGSAVVTFGRLQTRVTPAATTLRLTSAQGTVDVTLLLGGLTGGG